MTLVETASLAMGVSVISSASLRQRAAGKDSPERSRQRSNKLLVQAIPSGSKILDILALLFGISHLSKAVQAIAQVRQFQLKRASDAV